MEDEMNWITTQIATKENGYGYSDYEMTVLSTPTLIVEMVLTIPFDDGEQPYLRFILGDPEERFDMDTPTLPLTHAQAQTLLAEQ
jgi:hypothetical protein